MALPEEVKEYIVQLTQLQSQLTSLETEVRVWNQQYSNQRNAILAQIEALLNPA